VNVGRNFLLGICLLKEPVFTALPFIKLHFLGLLLEEPLEEADFKFEFRSWNVVGRHLPQRHANATELPTRKTRDKDMTKNTRTTFGIVTSAFLYNLRSIIKNLHLIEMICSLQL
jgi:hypothetical protein